MTDRLIDRYKPTRAPYRVEKMKPCGTHWVDRCFDDQRDAMAYLMMRTQHGMAAVLFDADDVFIASVDCTDAAVTQF